MRSRNRDEKISLSITKPRSGFVDSIISRNFGQHIDGGFNRRDRLGGIPEYASAQSLDFLDLGQKFSFLNWKRRKVPIFKKTINGGALSKS